MLVELRGAGVGGALLGSLIERVPGFADGVRLEYADGNDRAARFYARNGFVEAGREPGERPGWPGWPGTVWAQKPLAEGRFA